jgi:hypothetical protein
MDGNAMFATLAAGVEILPGIASQVTEAESARRPEGAPFRTGHAGSW